MAQDEYPYPEDEFDRLGKNRSPQAVHRAPRPWWRTWGPLIAVVVLAPVLAIVLVQFISSDGGDAAAEPDATATATSEVTAEETADGTDPAESAEPTDSGEDPVVEETTEPTVEETTEAPLDQSVAVSVLNGASIAGLAGETTDILIAAGWANATAGNYQSGSRPSRPCTTTTRSWPTKRQQLRRSWASNR